MSDHSRDSKFELLDLPSKPENAGVAGPYTRSPALSPRVNSQAEPVTLTIDGKEVTTAAGTVPCAPLARGGAA